MVVADTSHSQPKRFAGSGRMVSLLPYGCMPQNMPGRSRQVRKEQHTKETVQLAVSKAMEALLGKACKVLPSSGVAPDTRETWNLFEQKHPRGPIPLHPSHQEIVLPLKSFKLPPDLNIR